MAKFEDLVDPRLTGLTILLDERTVMPVGELSSVTNRLLGLELEWNSVTVPLCKETLSPMCQSGIGRCENIQSIRHASVIDWSLKA